VIIPNRPTIFQASIHCGKNELIDALIKPTPNPNRPMIHTEAKSFSIDDGMASGMPYNHIPQNNMK
jgi:hypothetical protein